MPYARIASAEFKPGVLEKEIARFHEYCGILQSADYDIKAIKLADRLNNMNFIHRVPGHAKIRRYLREAEDFYIAYTMLPPKMPAYYVRMRNAYDRLRALPVQEVVATH